MKIFFLETIEQLVVEGTRYLWPPRSLQASVSVDQIEVWLKGENRRIVGPIPFGEVQTESGAVFATAPEAKAYLDTEFAKGTEHNELSTANW